MRQPLLTLTLVLTLLASWTCRADEITQPYKGLTVTANLETSGSDWKAKPVLLMTHGTLAHNRMEIIQTLQNAFKDRGYSSLAINLSYGMNQRSGMYDCPTPHRHRHTDALDEIGLWLAWLKQQGVQSVVLLGHSRGGNQTAWYAVERADASIHSAVLLAPQTWDKGQAQAEYKNRYKQALAPRLAEAEQLVSSGKAQQMMKNIGFIYCADTSASAEAFVAYYRPDQRLDTPHLVPTIKHPVLVIAGSEDTVVSGLIDKMQPITDGERVQLAVIEGADHYFRDLYADEVADTVVTFIESR